MKVKVAVFAVLLGVFWGFQAQALDLPAWLDKALEKLPDTNQATIYSMREHDVQYASTFTLVSYKDLDLDIGWTPKAKLLGAVSISLLKAKSYVNIPILDLIVFEPLVYLGFDRIENLKFEERKELGVFDWGFGAKLLEYKF